MGGLPQAGSRKTLFPASPSIPESFLTQRERGGNFSPFFSSPSPPFFCLELEIGVIIFSWDAGLAK